MTADRETWLFLGKTMVSALVIAGASSLAQRSPAIAGYLTALPLASILALSFAYTQSGDAAGTARYGTSILAAIPLSVLFFLPFLLYPRFKGSFWPYLAAGIALLYLGSFLHRALLDRLGA